MSEQKTHSILESIKNKLSRINGDSVKKSKFDEIHKEFDSEIALNAAQSSAQAEEETSKNLQNEGNVENLNEDTKMMTEQYEESDIEKIAAAIEAEEKAAIEATKEAARLAKEAKELQEVIAEKEALESAEAEELAKLAAIEDSEVLNETEADKSVIQDAEKTNDTLLQELLVQNTETDSNNPLSLSFESVLGGENSENSTLSSIEDIQKEIGDVSSLLSAEGSNSSIDPLSILEEGDFSKSSEESEAGESGDMVEIAAKAIAEASTDESSEQDESSKARSLEDAEKALFGEEFVVQKYGSASSQEAKNNNQSSEAVPEKKANEPEKIPLVDESAKMPIKTDSKESEVEVIEDSKEPNSLETATNPEVSHSPNPVKEASSVITELKTEIDSELQKVLMDIGSEDKKSKEIEDEIQSYNSSKEKTVVENSSENKINKINHQSKPIQDLAADSKPKENKAEQSVDHGKITNNLSEVSDKKSIADLDLPKTSENEDQKRSNLSDSSESEEVKTGSYELASESFSEDSGFKKSTRLINDETLVRASFSVKKLIDAKNSINKASQISQDNELSVILASIMEPKLEKWLNENLAEIVERIVREEVSRIVKDYK